MNFQQLKHFVFTAEIGNILKAAEHMHISQSGLSRSISALEHQIGLPLFERSAKGVELTAFGRNFYPSAKLILNEQRRSVEELKAFRELRAGSLTLGINHSFAYFLAPEIIAELIRTTPDVSLSVVANNYQALAQALATGDLDLVLSLYTEPSKRDDLRYEKLFEMNTRVYAAADHPLAQADHITPDVLAGASWALINGASARIAFDQYFASRNLPIPKVSLGCASVAMMATVVSQTELLTILPEPIAEGVASFGLAQLPVEGQFGIASVGLIQRAGAGEYPIAERIAKLVRRRVTKIMNAQPS